MKRPASATELLQALVRIPSVNPAGNPGTDRVGEKRCAEYVGGFLDEMGADAELREVLPERPNVVARFPSDREGKPRILFAPHVDTVSVAGMTIDPFGGEIRDGKLWGRGASDTKGTMAAMLWALWEMRKHLAKLRHEIWFAGSRERKPASMARTRWPAKSVLISSLPASRPNCRSSTRIKDAPT